MVVPVITRQLVLQIQKDSFMVRLVLEIPLKRSDWKTCGDTCINLLTIFTVEIIMYGQPQMMPLQM